MERRRQARRRMADSPLGDVPLSTGSSSSSGGRHHRRRPQGRTGGEIRSGNSGGGSRHQLATVVPAAVWKACPLHELLFLALVEGDPEAPRGYCRALLGLLPEALAAALIGDLVETGALELRKPAATFFGGIKKPLLVRPQDAGANPFPVGDLRYEALEALVRRPMTSQQAVEALAHGLARVVERGERGAPQPAAAAATAATKTPPTATTSAAAATGAVSSGAEAAALAVAALVVDAAGLEPAAVDEADGGAKPEPDEYHFSPEAVLRHGLHRLAQRTGRAMRSWTADAVAAAGGRGALKQALETCVWLALQTACANVADQRTAVDRAAAAERSVPRSLRRQLRLAALYFAVDPMLRCSPRSATAAERKAAKKRGMELCELIDSGSLAPTVQKLLEGIARRQQAGTLHAGRGRGRGGKDQGRGRGGGRGGGRGRGRAGSVPS